MAEDQVLPKANIGEQLESASSPESSDNAEATKNQIEREKLIERAYKIGVDPLAAEKPESKKAVTAQASIDPQPTQEEPKDHPSGWWARNKVGTNVLGLKKKKSRKRDQSGIEDDAAADAVFLRKIDSANSHIEIEELIKLRGEWKRQNHEHLLQARTSILKTVSTIAICLIGYLLYRNGDGTAGLMAIGASLYSLAPNLIKQSLGIRSQEQK